MKVHYVSFIAAALALLPAAAMAAPITVTPRSPLSMGTGHFGKISATTSGAAITLHSSTCFSVSGNSSPRDILKVVSFDKANGKYTIQVRAQKAGTCSISFASGSDTATLHVTVEQAE